MRIPAAKLLLYIDIFPLTFAVGINAYAFWEWYTAPLSPEEIERRYIGRTC